MKRRSFVNAGTATVLAFGIGISTSHAGAGCIQAPAVSGTYAFTGAGGVVTTYYQYCALDCHTAASGCGGLNGCVAPNSANQPWANVQAGASTQGYC